jgi:hypothetical protein
MIFHQTSKIFYPTSEHNEIRAPRGASAAASLWMPFIPEINFFITNFFLLPAPAYDNPLGARSTEQLAMASAYVCSRCDSDGLHGTGRQTHGVTFKRIGSRPGRISCA